ncbi:hypothetical protein [Enterococcus saccharolyticus]|uniref:hypothetical protein n=1 Tax=Enterococcus saccharolyticus TaxID=41997 RepID=UPI0039E07DE3
MKKIFLSLLLSLSLFGGLGNILVHAEEDNLISNGSIAEGKTITLITSDYASDEDVNNAISNYLESGEVTTVNVIDAILLEDETLNNNISTRASGLSGSYIETGALLNKVSGPTGMTLNLAYTKSISRSISGQYGISNSFISATVGYSVSGSDTVSFSGTYTVPKQYKRATISGYALNQVKRLSVYKTGPRFDRYIYSKRPIGISYSYNLQK